MTSCTTSYFFSFKREVSDHILQTQGASISLSLKKKEIFLQNFSVIKESYDVRLNKIPRILNIANKNRKRFLEKQKFQKKKLV